MAESVISLQDVTRYYLMGEFVVKALDGVSLISSVVSYLPSWDRREAVSRR